MTDVTEMTEPRADNTAVVIVTYGDRSVLVEKVVSSITDIGFAKIIIVDNGSIKGSEEHLHSIASNSGDRVVHIRLEENTGSAGGFKRGIFEASRLESTEFIWLLDDDNQPCSCAFSKLVEAYRLLGSDQRVALFSLRLSRREYFKAATTGAKIQIRKNAFLGFHLLDRLKGSAKGDEDLSVGFNYPLLTADYAPYGGFFFSKAMQQTVGLPEESLFLYSDDHEYSLRWKGCGGKIYLCAQSLINEIDESWGGASDLSLPILIRPDSDDKKIFFFVRNRIYLEKKSSAISPGYWFNGLMYFSYIIALGLAKGVSPKFVLSRIRLIVRAVQEGLAFDPTAENEIDGL